MDLMNVGGQWILDVVKGKAKVVALEGVVVPTCLSTTFAVVGPC